MQESVEYVESIIADVQRLGIEFKPPITYTSDYFPEMLDLAERLIKAGFLYADDTPVEQMREVRSRTDISLVLQKEDHVKMSGAIGVIMCTLKQGAKSILSNWRLLLRVYPTFPPDLGVWCKTAFRNCSAS